MDIGAVATEATAIAAEMATQVLIVTTPDVLALRGVRRMRELWKRLGVREDEDVKVVLNRASRRREIQPDLARKVVGERWSQTTIPADFAALEAAVNTGSPARLEDGKLRGAFESLAAELDVIPRRGRTPGREPRGLLARLGGERGQTSAEFMGMLPILLLVVFGLWQIAHDRLHVRRRRPRRARGRPPARRRLPSDEARPSVPRRRRARTCRRAWRQRRRDHQADRGDREGLRSRSRC